jgi:hypothetical protein
VAPSRISEEIQRALGRRELIVSVIVPSPWRVERTIAAFQDPPLGLYRTPEEVSHQYILTYRDYVRELAMQSHAEVHRLTEDGWQVVAVTPEYEGEVAIGQRYVFRSRATIAQAGGASPASR